MILSGVVNPDNIGKVGTVVAVYTEGWTEGDELVETVVIDVRIEEHKNAFLDELETLYEIHNDYEVIES